MIVRWRTRGALVEAGEAYSRDAGDEDEMVEADAKTLARAGVVEVVGAAVPVVADVEEDER